MRKVIFGICLLAGVACSSEAASGGETDQNSDTTVFSPPTTQDFGAAPDYPEGDLSAETVTAINTLRQVSFATDNYTDEQQAAVQALGASQDPRVAWFISDLIRLSVSFEMINDLAVAANDVLETDATGSQNIWNSLTNRLIAWDIPAPPNYLEAKRDVYSALVPEWEPLFEDGREVDWRYVSWGGVSIDLRPYNTTDDDCNCIPAADNPEVVSASEANWPADDDIIFGVEINGEARAYPRQIMEVREMINDTLGGRDFAMPYCTLCGSAQVFFTDDVPDGVERPIMRTSGLLIRSNKVMFDIESLSVFDTFTGEAVTGPLADQGIELDQATVLVTSWGEWKQAHPETSVLAEELALGRDFDFRSGRDASGPIFPVGDVDPRLPVQEDVIGVVTSEGEAIAFPAAAALDVLAEGGVVELDGVELVGEAGGLRAVDNQGNDIASHQAFWFAWSQFHPETSLWES